MSIKSTLTAGDNFHLYEQLFDEKIYLELEGEDFEASKGKVTVAIPSDIWEIIRHHKKRIPLEKEYVE